MHGDLVFSTTALYDVTLTAPEDVVLVTSGSMVGESASGNMVERGYVTGPAREFTVIADNDFASMSPEVDGTTVNVWFNQGREAGAEAILTYGAQALATFNELFGAYPFSELDLVEAQMGGPGGIEYSQLVGLDTSLFEDPGVLEEQGFPPHLPEYITAHEVAHQWWYGLVGNNHYESAFLDEGMAEASTIIYFEEQYDETAAQQQMLVNLSTGYAYQYAVAGDHVVDQPTDDFPDGGAYFGSVYAKAAMGFLAIREEVGAEAFAEGMQAYVDQMRFGVASPEDMRVALEEASGMDLEQLWNSWFETAGDRVNITIDLDVDDSATPAP
jgi:aminopeptidase N